MTQSDKIYFEKQRIAEAADGGETVDIDEPVTREIKSLMDRLSCSYLEAFDMVSEMPQFKFDEGEPSDYGTEELNEMRVLEHENRIRELETHRSRIEKEFRRMESLGHRSFANDMKAKDNKLVKEIVKLKDDIARLQQSTKEFKLKHSPAYAHQIDELRHLQQNPEARAKVVHEAMASQGWFNSPEIQASIELSKKAPPGLFEKRISSSQLHSNKGRWASEIKAAKQPA